MKLVKKTTVKSVVFILFIDILNDLWYIIIYNIVKVGEYMNYEVYFKSDRQVI